MSVPMKNKSLALGAILGMETQQSFSLVVFYVLVFV